MRRESTKTSVKCRDKIEKTITDDSIHVIVSVVKINHNQFTLEYDREVARNVDVFHTNDYIRSLLN